jgi:AcrR family transcriptional regulator
MTCARTAASRPAKIAVRERGKKRTAALLAGAEKVFAASGFEAAVMSDIARAAHASVGSLYQYFPTKESLAEALLFQYTTAFANELEQWRKTIPTSADVFADELVSLTLRTIGDMPAWVVLFASPALGAYRRDALAVLTGTMAGLLHAWAPNIPEPRTARVAHTIWQLVRGVIHANATVDTLEAEMVVDEMRVVLGSYLKSQLTA